MSEGRCWCVWDCPECGKAFPIKPMCHEHRVLVHGIDCSQ